VRLIDTRLVGIKCPSWIDGGTACAHLEVQVGTGGSPRLAHPGDGLAAADHLTRTDEDLGGVGVERRDSVAVVHLDGQAVAGAPPGL
jgi:hypothetical protein